MEERAEISPVTLRCSARAPTWASHPCHLQILLELWSFSSPLVFIDEDLAQLLSLLHLPWMQKEEEDEPTSCNARAH
jgi:hypothetical protein